MINLILLRFLFVIKMNETDFINNDITTPKVRGYS